MSKFFFNKIFKILIIVFFIFLLYFRFIRRQKEGFEEPPQKTYVCMYAYYEKNDEYKNNLTHFLNNAIHDEIDYYIIINGSCTVEIPTRKNITIVRRENHGFDFGAWAHCIKNVLKKKYDYYIFLNSSVIGPIGVGSDGSPPEWLQKFLDLFHDGPDIKLVGSTINVLMNTWEEYSIGTSPPYTHVQSMFFILNSEGFNFLLERGFFDDEETLNHTTDMKYMVYNKEIKMSQLILKNGWNINAILPKYRGKDYREITENFNPSSENPYRVSEDPPNKKNYFGEDIKPEEVIFYKTNVSNVV